jgi:regulator of sirC expression with transglutaminase-like and TPR domain
MVLFTICFISSNIICQSKIDYNKLTVEDILKLPEEKINIGLTTLILAKEFYPNLNVDFFLHAFDYMADRYKFFFGKYKKPIDRIGALNTYLYKPGFWNDSITFFYDDDDLDANKLDNNFINGYIANKKGSCVTMPMLYVVLGERLGFPIYPVRAPMHYFVRYVEKNSYQNIEATTSGQLKSDEEYKSDALIPDNAIINGVYLRTLTKKEYIASLLLTNEREYLARGNIEKVKYYLLLAIKYDSTLSSAYWNYGLTALDEAKKLEEKLWEEKESIVGQNTIPTEFQKSKIDELEKKYEPLIMKKMKVYKEFTGKAEKLGIVRKYPESFYAKQKESIEIFKRNGGY